MLTEDYPRPGSYGRGSSPDLDFIYSDADLYDNEISELYSYTEHSEFQLNVKAFEDQMETYDLPPNWQKLTADNRKSIIFKLLDQLDVAQRDIRMRSARCILYLAQGCWAEIQSDQEQEQNTKDNIKLLYKLGVFASFVELLNLEIRSSSTVQDTSVPKPHEVSLSDSTDLRVILSVLYIMTETIRTEYEAGKCQEYIEIYQTFQKEVNVPYDEELLTVKLLGMTTRFCSGTAPHFPIKKVLLLLWKVSLLSMGGMSSLRDLKNEYREKNNLDRLKEDTIEITRQMRSSSPPATAADILESQNQKEGRRIAFRRCTNEAFIEEQMDMESQTGMVSNSNNGEAEDDMPDYFRNCNALPLPEQQENQQPFPNNSMLPWQPKVRQKDLEQFLEISRSKFIGYTLVNDLNTLAGLPEPIHEGYKILKNHMYTSLADVQIKLEENIARNPLTTNEGDILQTSAEILYQAILPNLPQYMIALLKVLLAASPTSKSKTESINIMSDVLPKEIPLTEMASTKLEIDVNRHKEIIVKAVSGTLLLYLKHFKINHIYQFEFMSQHLVFANCIPLVLKFFNQNITDYVTSKNNIPLLDFPSCVLGDQTNLTSENLVFGDNAPFSWRNMFSCINLLRILNKLIKWKHSRVMMLVVFKSAPILKKALKVRHAMMQLYVLKLLKMQTKYLGRQWRKTNMKTISAIYSKVRHRLNDDWAFGNDLESRPWDFQAEECTLRTCVDRFNNRRYPEATLKCQSAMNTQVQEPVTQGDDLQTDNINNNDNGLSLGGNLCMGNSGGDENDPDHVRNCGCNGIWLDVKVELTDDFKANYEMWLDEEVSGTPIDWDILIKDLAQPIN